MGSGNLARQVRTTPIFTQFQINRHYLHYWSEMPSVLSDFGWEELSCDTDEASLHSAYSMLSDIIPAYASRKEYAAESSSGARLNIELEPPRVLCEPSVLQFFFDLYQLDGSNVTGFTEILLSFLHLEDDRSQSYLEYFCDTFPDIEELLSSIREEPALIFPGRFQSKMGPKRMTLNTQEASQRTLNGICVDLDPAPDELGDVPMDSSVLESILTRVAPSLRPNYICLTGRGLHLWYVFSTPLQTFRVKNPRRAKLKALSRALYSYYGALLSGCPCVLDTHCSALNHGFRAPGSLTKRGNVVRCFCPPGLSYRRSVCDPLELSRELQSFDWLDYPSDLALTPDDVKWKSYQELHDEIAARELERKSRPASEDQLIFMQDLADRGALSSRELEQGLSASLDEANDLIAAALRRKGYTASGRIPRRDAWKTSPHPLTAGETGGVYRVVYESITKVPVGRRYLSLYMLAGVAFMTDRPQKSRVELKADMLALLDTAWAKRGTPLTTRDVANALTGYKSENWQTRNSIVEALGFDPFAEPWKRNGRSRAEHLGELARPAAAKKKRAASLDKIVCALRENPEVTKGEVVETMRMSYSTVSKYWAEACSIAGVEDTRSRTQPSRRTGIQ